MSYEAKHEPNGWRSQAVQGGSGLAFKASARAWRRLRLIPLAIAVIAMIFGLWTGLQRLGLPLPGTSYPPSDLHSAFMIAGFLGTVISLERAVAYGRGWAYAAPAFSGFGAVMLISNTPDLAALAFIAASAVLLAVTVCIALRQFAMFTVVLAIAAACWTIGTILWASGQSMPSVVGWWLNFLILTIAAERLELSRILRVTSVSQAIFFFLTLLLLVGAARAELGNSSSPLTAAGLIGFAAWMLHHDIARRTIRQTGQPRFSAYSILLGHGWLAVAGLTLSATSTGLLMSSYDATIHAVAIGFVLSMIFGHAPIILPAVTGIRIQFSRMSYIPLALLHLSILIRVVSDLVGWTEYRVAGGILTIVALAGYALTVIATTLLTRRDARKHARETAR